MHIQRTCPPQEKAYWCNFGLIQDGKFSVARKGAK